MAIATTTTTADLVTAAAAATTTMMAPPVDIDIDTATSALVPVLIVLVAVVMTLEILHHLLLARVTAVGLMGLIWSGYFHRELQIKAMVAALVYHGAFELILDWHRSRRSSCSVRKARDRKVILSLLFLVRVFIWGAAFAATSSVHGLLAAPSTTSNSNSTALTHSSYVAALLTHSRDSLVRAITTVVALVVYCEAIEVLVLLYFADDDVPYDWRRRALLWQLSSVIGVCEATGLLPFVARVVLARVSPLALLGVLLAGLWGSIQLPAWHDLQTHERPSRLRTLSNASSNGDDDGVEELIDDQFAARASRELQDDADDDPLLR